MSGQSWKEITDQLRESLPKADRSRKKYLQPGAVMFDALPIGALFWFRPDGEIMEKCSGDAASFLVGRGTKRAGHKTGVYPLTEEQAATARKMFPRPRVPVDGRDFDHATDNPGAAAGADAKPKRKRAPRKVPPTGGQANSPA